MEPLREKGKQVDRRLDARGCGETSMEPLREKGKQGSPGTPSLTCGYVSACERAALGGLVVDEVRLSRTKKAL